MNRKNFLKTVGLGAVASTVILSACGGDAPKTDTNSQPPAPDAASEAPSAPAADCNDLSGLAEADVKQRESVEYVTASTDPEKRCNNCRFMKPNSEPNGCSGCQLFKGPVNPEGNCKSWFKKDA